MNLKRIEAPVEVNSQIEEALHLLQQVLKDDVLGVYLYGSMMLGGLQKYSDIDLFAVSKRSMTPQEKQRLVEHLLTISATYPPTGKRRSIELTIVVQSELKPWKYPPSFDFQYGDWMRKDYEKGVVALEGSTINPDIAIIATQVLLTTETIHGPDPHELIDNVPYGDFMRATSGEIGDLLAELKDDTRNVLLTLARIWHTLTTDSISTKQDVAKWTLAILPQEFKPVMEHALRACLGEVEEDWTSMPEDLVKGCADFMVVAIKTAKTKIDFNASSKKISIS